MLVSMLLPSPCQEIIDSLCSNANSKYILVMVSIGSNNLLTSNLENKADKKQNTQPKQSWFPLCGLWQC